jgi:carbamoyltransferase
MIVLGINAFHADASAAILKDGVLIAAAEEERFCRIKHWAGFPEQSIQFCLKEAGVSLAEVDHVAINQDNKANLWRKVLYAVRNSAHVDLLFERIKNRAQRKNVPALLQNLSSASSFKGAFHQVEHHLAHLASAFYVSPFSRAAVVSVDGFGDFSSAAWGIGEDNKISITNRVIFPHSLGIFYQAITQFLGFPNYGDEYKVMGLAPYGSPSHVGKMRELVKLQPHGGFELNLNYFRHHRERIAYQWNDGSPTFSELFSPALEELLGRRRQRDDPIEERHKDIASSLQSMYEIAFFNMISPIQKETGITDIALAGGCAMNSVANGKIRRQTGYRRVYVQAAAGDAGGAVGAAYAVWHKLGGARRFAMNHGYWGPSYREDYISRLIDTQRDRITSGGCNVSIHKNEADLCREVAQHIADGKVVGWFQGRMEWGPRALGNRSIICDPRRGDMKEILNLKIKRRESFRPFAPSILEDAVGEWFEEEDAVPFMMQVFQIQVDKRDRIPAVCHVDGSGRLQTVSAKENGRYYKLIDAFRAISGVPMVLNTSFNENEPIVCKPEEALECFLRTNMDVLVLGDHVIRRPSAS